MKKIATLIAAPIALLLLSASAQAADAPATPAQGSTLYCWKEKLYADGGNLVCNWADNKKDACYGGPSSNVAKDSITAQPADVKRCENGQWLVQVTKK